jgi:peptidyl-prolyl cis-trans isomerase NIMA-interacting 1
MFGLRLFPQGAPPLSARSEEGLPVVDTVFPIRSSSCILGRDPLRAHIALDHISISRKHATIQFDTEPMQITLHVESGTCVNGTLVPTGTSVVLQLGDRVRLGACPDVLEVVQLQEQDSVKLVPSGPDLLQEDNNLTNKKRPRSDSVEDVPKRLKSEVPSGEIAISEMPVIKEETIPAEKVVQTPSKIRASHILVKHVESRNPSSWRDKKIIRTKPDAHKKLQNIRDKIMSTLAVDPNSNIFEKIAQTESDCSSAKNAGDLNFFSREKMMPEFSNAAFALQIGEISQIIETSSGWHIIKRTA